MIDFSNYYYQFIQSYQSTYPTYLVTICYIYPLYNTPKISYNTSLHVLYNFIHTPHQGRNTVKQLIVQNLNKMKKVQKKLKKVLDMVSKPWYNTSHHMMYCIISYIHPIKTETQSKVQNLNKIKKVQKSLKKCLTWCLNLDTIHPIKARNGAKKYKKV